MDSKDLATFLLERNAALEILILLFYTEYRNVGELREDLDCDASEGELSTLLTDMMEVGLLEIHGQKVSLTEKGLGIATTLLEGVPNELA